MQNYSQLHSYRLQKTVRKKRENLCCAKRTDGWTLSHLELLSEQKVFLDSDCKQSDGCKFLECYVNKGDLIIW